MKARLQYRGMHCAAHLLRKLTDAITVTSKKGSTAQFNGEANAKAPTNQHWNAHFWNNNQLQQFIPAPFL